MSASFERKKNSQALMITTGVAAVFFLVLILVKWSLPSMPTLNVQEFLEVNLGNSDFGSGDDQPLLPGEPAQAEQIAYNPPTAVRAVEDNAKDVETDDRNADAPEIVKPVASKANATKINTTNKEVKTVTKTQAVITNTPPKPKAVAGRTLGGKGNGGNGADSYKPGAGEGISGGIGDQGRVGGSPNGNTYTGNPRNFGVKVLQIPSQSFEDDFDENAKVAMDVEVNANGKVVSATYQAKGSTTSRSDYIEKARRYAFQLKSLGSSEAGQKGTVVFNFKVRG